MKLNNLRAIFIFSAMLSAEEEVALRERDVIQGSCTAAEKHWVAYVEKKKTHVQMSFHLCNAGKKKRT